MNHLLISAIVLLAGCRQKQEEKILSIFNNKTPTWSIQNIDTIPSCEIIPCEGVKIIHVGSTYTASYTFPDLPSLTWWKSDLQKTGLDFSDMEDVQYFKDTCDLKESLRSFIKLQMVKYKLSHQ